MDRTGICLVGDDSAAAVLREAGHEVVFTGDVADCLARLERVHPDIIVLDSTMLEICSKIKDLQGFMPVMAIARKNDVQARIDALRSGADDVLCKPFDPRELLARVEAQLRTRRRFLESARPSVIDEDEGRDPLTGLANQRAFTHRLTQALEHAARTSDMLSVMAVDLDGLSEVNSRFGRGAGDRIIEASARAIERSCREGDLVARAGGDEFVAILPRIHFAGAAVIADKVRTEIARGVILDRGSRITCQASVGVASYPSRDVESSRDLLRFAHAALARAKAEGRGQVCLYQQHGYLIQTAP